MPISQNFLYLKASAAMGAHLMRKFEDSLDRFAVANPVVMDVTDKIPVGVCVARLGPISKVGGHALGRGESGSFADEQDHDDGLDEVSDVIHDADAASRDEEWSSDTPTSVSRRSRKHLEYRRAMFCDRSG